MCRLDLPHLNLFLQASDVQYRCWPTGQESSPAPGESLALVPRRLVGSHHAFDLLALAC